MISGDIQPVRGNQIIWPFSQIPKIKKIIKIDFSKIWECSSDFLQPGAGDWSTRFVRDGKLLQDVKIEKDFKMQMAMQILGFHSGERNKINLKR